MSKVQNFIQQRSNDIAMEEVVKNEMTTVSVRLQSHDVKRLDAVAGRLELTRSDVIRGLIAAAADEAVETLGMTFEDIYGGAADE